MATARQPLAAPRFGSNPLSLLLLCVFLGATLATFTAPQSLSRWFIGVCAFAAVGVLLLQVIYKATDPRGTNWVSVDILFMLGFVVVHFTYPLFWSIGVLPSESGLWYSERHVCFGTAIALAGLAAFALGFNLLADRYSHVRWASHWNVSALQRWKAIGVVLFLLGCGATVIWVQLTQEERSRGGYVHITEMSYGARITFLASETFLRLGLVLLTVAAAQLTRRWKVGLVPKISLVLFIGWLLLLGDRSEAAAIGLVVLAAYSEYVRRIPLKFFIPVLVGGLLLMAVVRLARHAPEHTVGSFVRTAQAQSEELTWHAPLMGFGASVQTLYAAVATIPAQHDFYNGKLQMSTVMGIIPFSRRLLPPEQGYTTSARVLTDIINTLDEKWGRGTTVVADLYCDFGVPGVLVVLFALGLLSKRIQQRARASNSLTWAIAHTALIANMALMARFTAATLVRGVLWPVLAIWLLSAIFGLPRNAALPEEAAQPLPTGGPVSSGQGDTLAAAGRPMR
jgi:hypothetical protein